MVGLVVLTLTARYISPVLEMVKSDTWCLLLGEEELNTKTFPGITLYP